VKLQQLFTDLTKAFHKFECPQIEARHLLREALEIDLNQLVLRADALVPASEVAKVYHWRDERLKGVPLAYLSGRKAFHRYEFLVRPGVLVPRPETELVVEVALERAPLSGRIADLGCGSGCIGLTLLKEIEHSLLTAVDSSAVAAAVTRENAAKLNLSDRVEIVEQAVEKWISRQPVDLIVANPPYIAEGDERVQESVHQFEPHEALYAADQGLGALRSWIAKSWSQLRPGGLSVVEFGSGQSGPVQEIMMRTGFRDIVLTRDLSGLERVISAFKPE